MAKVANPQCIDREYVDLAFGAIMTQIKELMAKLDDLHVLFEKKRTSPTTGKKRRPSKYNLFIGKCMKGTGKTMKQCASEYKAAKAAGTLDDVIGEEA